MTTLVKVFDSLIDHAWCLERRDSDWFVREHNKTETPELKVFGAKAFGFSLDQAGKTPWPFLQAMKGVRSVCDAVVVTCVEDCHYVVAIEMKSSNTSKAGKQIKGTRLLAQWLLDVLALHGHWTEEWKFCGVISCTPRRQERKGTTRRVREAIDMDKVSDYPVAYLKNRNRLNLHDLHNRLVAL